MTSLPYNPPLRSLLTPDLRRASHPKGPALRSSLPKQRTEQGLGSYVFARRYLRNVVLRTEHDTNIRMMCE